MSEEKHIYVIIPRTVDSSKPPYKVCITCGRAAAYAFHIAARVQRILPDEDISMLTTVVLAVPSSKDLEEIIVGLDAEDITTISYGDESSTFEGELTVCSATLPVTKSQVAPILGKLQSWGCACRENI